MLSSMTPTIIAQGRQAVHGHRHARAAARSSTPCCTTILNVVDFGMNAQEAVDARALPSPVAAGSHQPTSGSGSRPTRSRCCKQMGHNVVEGGGQGAAQVIVFNQKDNMLEGGVDRRPSDGGAAGK